MSDWDRCSVDGCERVVERRGLCQGHYRRLLNTGDVRASEPLRGGSAPLPCDGAEAQRLASLVQRKAYLRPDAQWYSGVKGGRGAAVAARGRTPSAVRATRRKVRYAS